MPRKEILDPQGKASLHGLHNLGLGAITEARIGKRIELQLEAETREGAVASVEEACKKLLANTVIEQYDYEIVALT